MEANDKKREKSKKKYYWRQHYELRNVNNSKRLPLNDQDKEFKDMAKLIRIAIVGTSNSPGIYDMMIVLGKTEVIRRFTSLEI